MPGIRGETPLLLLRKAFLSAPTEWFSRDRLLPYLLRPAPTFRSPENRQSISCDSGAANDGRYLPHVKGSDLSALQIGPSLDAAQQVIHVLYENSREYFLGRPKDATRLSFETGEVATKYFDLLNDPLIYKSDDRRSAIEVVSRSQLSLRNNIEVVILPERFLDEEDLRRAIIEDWSAKIITYPTWQATCPSDYSLSVKQVLLDFLERHAIVTRNN